MKAKIIRVVFVSLAVLILIGAGVFAGVVFLSPKSDPQYVAHRGFSGKYRGNTLPAFEAAARAGFWGIETDIRLTADGVFVCEHDKTVKYQDGTELEVATNDFATLRAKPLRNNVSEEEVLLPTFKEYLAACKAGEKVAVIELKEVFSEDALALILVEVDEVYVREKCVFIAFDYENLTRLKAADPSLGLQYLSSTKNDPRFDQALQDGISIDVKDVCLSEKLVDRFHKAGLQVNVWTINDRWSLNKVRRAGVDFVTTDVYDSNP